MTGNHSRYSRPLSQSTGCNLVTVHDPDRHIDSAARSLFASGAGVVDYETEMMRVTSRNYSPGVYRHTLEDPLPSRPDNHVVADVITACEILKTGEELVDEREAGELMHRSVHSVLHITVLLGVLHEGLEGGDYVLGVLRSR